MKQDKDQRHKTVNPNRNISKVQRKLSTQLVPSTIITNTNEHI
jgi:hypothetical protein